MRRGFVGTLPQIDLTREQELEARQKARDGDSSSRELLINSQLRNAALTAYGFSRPRRIHDDDLISVAFETLTLCVDAWINSESVRARFGTYCTKSIIRAFIIYVRDELRAPHQGIEEAVPNGDPECPVSIHDAHLDAAIDALQDLPPVHRSVMFYRLDGMPMAEIAERMERSVEQIRRICRNSIDIMRTNESVAELLTEE